MDGNKLKWGPEVEPEPGCSCVLSGAAVFESGYGLWSVDEMEM